MNDKNDIMSCPYYSSSSIVNVEMAIIRTGNQACPRAVPSHRVHLETQGDVGMGVNLTVTPNPMDC